MTGAVSGVKLAYAAPMAGYEGSGSSPLRPYYSPDLETHQLYGQHLGTLWNLCNEMLLMTMFHRHVVYLMPPLEGSFGLGLSTTISSTGSGLTP